MLLIVLFSNQIKLFPTILLYWEKYQKRMLEKVKAVKDGIIIAGDGRHDSMGHCAKYGAYTIFCCTIPMILHFSLIQVRGSTFLLEISYCKKHLQPVWNPQQSTPRIFTLDCYTVRNINSHIFISLFIYNQQRNQAGSSPAMEFMGFKSCMEFLIGYGLLITAFVSDRHVSIAAYMKRSLTAITHYFDIWHLKKSKNTCSLEKQPFT